MKNVHLKLFYFFISFVFSFEVISEDLFSYKIYSDAKEYFSKNFLDNNKFKHTETKTGYYRIDVTVEMSEINTSPYFEEYYLDIDNNDVIHGIIGIQPYKNMEICKSVAEQFKENVISKYNVQLKNSVSNTATFKSDAFEGYTNNDMRVSINCNYYYNDENTEMWFFVMSPDLQVAVIEFYDSM